MPTHDEFEKYNSGKASPAEGSFEITPDDSNDLAENPRAIYVGVAGDIRATLMEDSAPVVFTAVPIGVWPFRIKRLYATGTSAGGIIGLK